MQKRKMKCFQISGVDVQSVLDDFNEHMDSTSLGLEIASEDIISVSVMPPTHSIPTAGPKGAESPRVEVVIVYWSYR